MHFIPILSTLRRHRTAAVLIVLEIALTCAIVCNAIFLIGDRLSRMERPSGVAEDELVRIKITGIGKQADPNALTAQDLIALRSIPGVKYAATTDMIPFGGSSWNTSVGPIKDDDQSSVNVANYMGSEDLLETLGVQLIAGRDFTPEEYVPYEANKVHVPSVILTRPVAERLFPGKSAIGQKVYATGDDPQVVVGVIEMLGRPNELNGVGNTYCSMILPVNMPYTKAHNYILRVDPTRRDEILGAVEATLDKVDPSRIILDRQTMAEVRKDFFKQDRAMAYLLIGVSLALLIVTALGIVGLASFWVQQRTRHIGIRRALGATRKDIRRYFQTENFILATVGIVVGMALAYAINLWLMKTYAVPRLPAEFLPIGALLLWCLGQVAVLGPAMRASMIRPAIATRTV
jgi:putative ABC transport system permease protein